MHNVRIATAVSFAAILLASACSTPKPQPEGSREEVAALAPSGKLRVGVYTGSPTSYVAGGGGSVGPRGVAYERGAYLRRRRCKELR